MSWNRQPIQYTITDPGETGDSELLVLTGVSLERLEIAIGLVDNKYTGYKIVPTLEGLPRFVLMIYESGQDRIPLPTALDAKTMARLILQWLNNLKDEDFGKQPDIDGSIKRGWKATTQLIGIGDHSSVLSVEPKWIIFGK